MRYLLIAEKPSLMRLIRDCYNNHKSEINRKVGEIDFIALAGHLCGLYTPDEYEEWNCKWGEIDYPMIPTHWGIKPLSDRGKDKIMATLRKQVRNYDGIIVATDSDTEGYGIYYLVENYLKITDMPALRFIEHSLTDKEILEQLLVMTDYHTDPVHQRFVKSFVLRAKTDWLFGMNCTRLVSSKTNKLFTIGRVKAPTLKLVYDNSVAIENFKPETYYTVGMNYGNFAGILVDNKDNPVHFPTELEAAALNIPMDGIVKKVEKKNEKTAAPKLYDLSALQVEAGRIYGYTPKEVLDTVQSLYETHKLISYPRTQCRYVSEEKAKEFPDMLNVISHFPGLSQFTDQIKSSDIERVKRNKKVVNDKEVEKESHDALLPTSTKPDAGKLNEKEKKICDLIYRRLIAQFLPELSQDKAKVHLSHGGNDFLAKGKVVVDLGWRRLYGDIKDAALPDLKEGQGVHAIDKVIKTSQTKPPKRLTQSTLLLAMKSIANKIEDDVLRKSLENSQGIGTPATRDTIISDLIKRGYVQDKKGLYITPEGKAYIESIKDTEIISPTFAAVIDYDMKKVQRGEMSYEEAYDEVIRKLHEICSQAEKLQSIRPTTTYHCKKCGSPLEDLKWGLVCSNKECDFKISRSVCGRKITDHQIDLLFEGKTLPKSSFRKKDGSTFTARLVLKDDGLAFDFSSGLSCPFCGQQVREGKYGYFCTCGMSINSTIAALPEKDIKELLTKKKLPKRTFTSTKSGNKFEAAIRFDKDKKAEMVFDNKS